LNWKVHPLASNPKKSALLVLIIAVVLVTVQISFGEVFWTVFSAFILLIWLARYFFPTKYEFENEAVRVHFLGHVRERRWEEFRRFEVHNNGIFLSPYAKPNFLDNLRGLFILFQNNDSEVVEFVREKIENKSNQP
jgi:hypothetical protein